MKVRYLQSTVVSLLFLLAGCASTPKTYSTVQEGMSRNNLRYWFGEPVRIEHRSSGGEDWYYQFSAWQSTPTGESGTKDDFGQQTTYATAALALSKQVVELPVHLSPDGFVMRPVPSGKVVKE